MTWQQVETNSVRLLRRLGFNVMIWTFSMEQRWKNLEPILYGRAWAMTSHDTMGMVADHACSVWRYVN